MKNGFGLKGVWECLSKGNKSVLKTCHIYIIKLKTRVFRGLKSREISRETHWSFREKLLVAKQSRDSRDNLCMNLKNFQFLPKNILREEFSREIFVRQ